jgi:hypothetical protein
VPIAVALAAAFASTAPCRFADLWEVDAGHTQGLHDHPREYAHHVIGFFDSALLGR